MQSFQILKRLWERKINMALERHNFDVSTTENNIMDVVSWLNSNAKEYFSNVTYDLETRFITCSTGTNARLTFGVEPENLSNGSLEIVLENGADNSSVCGNGRNPGGKAAVGKISYAVKTSTGIALEFTDGDHSIIITKSNLGTTSIFVVWYGITFSASTINIEVYFACDLINSTEVFGTNFGEASTSNSSVLTSAINNGGRYYWSGNKPTGMTVFVPYCFIGDTYAPDMYLTPFSQYPRQKGILNCGGVNYYYNGYVALKE